MAPHRIYDYDIFSVIRTWTEILNFIFFCLFSFAKIFVLRLSFPDPPDGTIKELLFLHLKSICWASAWIELTSFFQRNKKKRLKKKWNKMKRELQNTLHFIVELAKRIICDEIRIKINWKYFLLTLLPLNAQRVKKVFVWHITEWLTAWSIAVYCIIYKFFLLLLYPLAYMQTSPENRIGECLFSRAAKLIFN